MGLILDSSILISGERRGYSVDEILEQVQSIRVDKSSVAVSAVTIVEVTHGIYRARSEADRARRQDFVNAVCESITVHPVSLPIARLAGRIEGEQSSKGIVIAFEDFVIGATAVYFNCAVITLNARHFRQIPGLEVVTR